MKKIFIIILFCFNSNLFSQKTYTNPILSGFYPDPSICRVKEDYYIVTSSFAYFPGLPVFHSKDLVNWKQIGHAMDRNEQLDLHGAGVSRGLFAPTIRYHKETFYIICTLIDKGGNFIITAKDPRGPWSNPNWIPEVNGIDPSLYFDEDDRTYIVYNSIPPDNISLHDGHRTIRMVEFDISSMKTKGKEKLLINGGTDMAKKPVWIEAPHILKKDSWYYLVCAEGGTGFNHSEVVFRSKSVDGPYVSYEKNPILTQRNLDPKRKNPITTTGHADFVETADGKWYAVFLGCRPYEGDYYNTGRETFMTPVEWKDGWPLINPGYEEVQTHYPFPFPQKTKRVSNNFSDNFYYKNEFNSKTLDPRFVFLRNPEKNLYYLNLNKGFLTVPVKNQPVSSNGNPAFIGFRQSHLNGFAATRMIFNPLTGRERAGMLIFQNETHYYFLARSLENNIPVVQLFQSGIGKEQLLASAKLSQSVDLFLKIEAKGDHYAFYYGQKKDQWLLLKDSVDGKFLSTKQAGGFVGCMYALYAVIPDRENKASALFDWFEYKGDDGIYK